MPWRSWENTRQVMHGAMGKSGVDIKNIAAIGITNQRETTLLWDRKTGRPVYNAIVWQDTRTDSICNELAKDGGQDRFRPRTGLPLATYFSGPKIKWMLDNLPDIRDRAEKGDLLFGNMDTWLIWNLTGRHVTDVTNASRTLLMDLHTLDWDEEILHILGIPRCHLTPHLFFFRSLWHDRRGYTHPHCRRPGRPAGRPIRAGLLYRR